MQTTVCFMSLAFLSIDAKRGTGFVHIDAAMASGMK
jgi:hypothetical protein